MLNRILVILIVAFFVVWPAVLGAQQQPGRMKGRVVDQSGNPVANIDVTIRSVDTGTESTVQTDDQGNFVVADLQPGKYLVQTSKNQTGSQPAQSKVDPACTTDLSLQTTATGQIAVMAEVVTQPDGTASIETTFSERPIELLPQPNATSRNGQYFGAYNLSLLSEGVSPGFVFQRGIGPSVAGRPNWSNNFHVNGADNNDPVVPGPLVRPSNEVTTEFSLMQNQYAPRVGQTTGGKFNIVLAQGTNAWHGDAYSYYSNRKLNAGEPVFGPDRGRIRFDQNRFGGKVGGPIMKDQLFAFFGFEYTPTNFDRRVFGTSLAPTPAGVAALAANPLVSRTNLGVLANDTTVTTTTPVTFTTVAGTVVPLAPVSTGIKTRNKFYNGIASIDWNRGGRSSLSARYIHNDDGLDVFSPTALPFFTVPGHTLGLLGTVNYTQTLSTATSFNIMAGYNRLNRTSGADTFFFPGQTAFPNIAIEALGLTLGPNLPIGLTKSNTYHGAGQLDWTTGGHHLTFGGDVRWFVNTVGKFWDDNGNYAYTSLERYLLDLPPDVVGRRSFGGTSFHGNQQLLFLYGQDSYRITKSINLEYGLGWQYASLPASLKTERSLSALSIPGFITFGNPGAEQTNLAPRVGIAWSPGARKTVIRGSFGMMYDALHQNSPFLSPDMTFGSVTTAAPNVPGFLANGGILPPTTLAGGVGTFVFEQKLPYVMQWSGAVSHEFFDRLAVDLKYMGNRGVHMPFLSLLDGNTSRVSAAASLPVFFVNPGQTALDSLSLTQAALAAQTTPLIAAGFTNPIFTVRHDGISKWNAAALKISERFTAGTQVAAQYTYSYAQTDSTGTPLDLAFGRVTAEAPWNVRHRVTITPIIDVAAMLPSTTGWVHNVLADLSFMGTVTYASSQQIPLASAVDTGMNGIGIGSGIFINPANTSGLGSGVVPLRNSSGSTVAFLAADPNAQFVTGGPGTFSTLRRVQRLSDTRNIDVALVKRFSILDKAKIEVRGDAYNVINRRNMTGLPVSTLGPGLGFLPTSNFVLLDNPQFGDIRGTLSSNPRTVQLALRVIF